MDHEKELKNLINESKIELDRVRNELADANSRNDDLSQRLDELHRDYEYESLVQKEDFLNKQLVYETRIKVFYHWKFNKCQLNFQNLFRIMNFCLLF